jgi:hypothetical protein
MASNKVNDISGKLTFVTTQKFLFEMSELSLLLRIMTSNKAKTIHVYYIPPLITDGNTLNLAP